MDRREFVSFTAVSALAVVASGCASQASYSSTTPSPSLRRDPTALDPNDLDEAPAIVQSHFDDLLVWLHHTGWAAYLSRVAGVDLDPRSPFISDELLKPIDPPRGNGFEDFHGIRAVQPGYPAWSFLYHALASPKVRLTAGDGTPAPPASYPSVQQLDALENYIYARLRVDAYDVPTSEMVLAVFAYEYRPADKTPHGAHGDLVFSRTGIARVGNREPAYSPEHRCFVNRPAAPTSSQDIAVTPARYALFLARPITGEHNLSIINVEMPRDRERTFLLPFRKLFTGDRLLRGATIFFSESHLNEKLGRLAKAGNIRLPPNVFDTDRAPFVRRSSTSTAPSFVPDPRHHDTGMVALAQQGSSVLVAPTPGDLVREAWQTTGGRRERVRILVPPYWRAWYSDDVTNRRYTTLKVEQYPHWNAVDYAWSDGVAGGGGGITGLRAPRNAPTFVNIRHEVTEDGREVGYLGASSEDFERIRAGGYWAAMFEDGICDGCVQAVLSPQLPRSVEATAAGEIASLRSAPILPAFSLATAPDLFPLVDGADMEELDHHFLEGGTEMLSGGRLRANPNIRLPGSDELAFPDPLTGDPGRPEAYTVTAVLTDRTVRGPWFMSATRDYVSTNTLPDTASNVFAPGWDVTYSGERGGDLTVHLSTLGLGLPFPEDIKLCAAANGMWPGSSPDAARTFQGNLKPVMIGIGRSRRPPTAVPLLDDELGYHPDSPAVRHHGNAASFGWDGEQGPFLFRSAGEGASRGRIHVNFADINASDYVVNARDSRMNVAVLQDLTTGELIARMDALRRCIGCLPGGGSPRHSRLWLVSAEGVGNWNAGAAGWGLPADLFHGSVRWATVSRLSHAGSGFLYVFADVRRESRPDPLMPARHTQYCDFLYVCQVGGGRVAWVRLRGDQTAVPLESAWTLVPD